MEGTEQNRTETKAEEQNETPKGNAEAADAGKGNVIQEENVLDKHGHPGISEGKYKRDIEAKDKEIADLRKRLGDAVKTEEGRKDFEEKIDALEKSLADERVAHALEMAGCRSVKAAKALLDDYDGDVYKLKAENPYLFEPDKPQGSLGVKPGGAPTMTRKQIMAIQDKDERLKAIQDNIKLFEN